MIYLLLLIGVIALLWLFGPYEKVSLQTDFDDTAIGGDIDAYFAAEEAKFDDIKPGAEKRVVWAGARGDKTDVVVLNVHGFSASSEEIRPVPDNLATALGANLIFTRLAGHGRTGDAMAEPTAADWMHDVAEALAVARKIGDKVIVISTSTGGTLMAAAALQDDLMKDVQGIIFVSPNFALNSPAAVLLTMPAVRWWGPIVAGRERRFEPVNDAHEAFWTTRYPTVAAFPMAALVKKVDTLDKSQATVPALFLISDGDKVVSPVKNRDVAAQWGGPSQLKALTMGAGDDPYSHVIAGDILSPGQTAAASQIMIDWANDLLGQ